MKNWITNNYKTLIISAFLFPIITVAIVSISHVTMWYGLSNPISWAMYLSLGIEVAALSALAAISANMGSKVYFPFIVVTIIQFIGNIFFAYSFINVTSKEFVDWVELVSPLLEFIGVESTNLIAHKRVLSLFSGGMLPVISLSFLHMLVKFTEETNTKSNLILEKKEEPPQPIVEELVVPEPSPLPQPKPLPTPTTIPLSKPHPTPTPTILIENEVTEELVDDLPPVKLSDEKLDTLQQILNRFNPMNIEEKYEAFDIEDEDSTYDEDGLKVDLDEYKEEVDLDNEYTYEFHGHKVDVSDVFVEDVNEEIVDPPVDHFEDPTEVLEDEVIDNQVEDENVSEDTEKKNS
jgi:hypothetical protein